MSDSDDQTSLRQCKEIDRIADEFERALRQGQRPSIEAYLEKNPDLRSSLLKELLAFEVEFRRSSNEHPHTAGVHRPLSTTSRDSGIDFLRR